MAVYPIGEGFSRRVQDESRGKMSERYHYGVRCKCGELFAVPELSQEQDVPIEELRDRLRRAGWHKVCQHGYDPRGCVLGKIAMPDDVVPVSAHREPLAASSVTYNGQFSRSVACTWDEGIISLKSCESGF